jgi:Flp pilus assembly protein TadD
VAAPVVAPIPAAPGPALTAASAPAAPQMDNAFVQARQLILGGQYDAGIAAMRALKFDDHPDVATFLGLAYRKLGRLDEARAWYERALAVDPNHRLALSFYGMMRAETGDMNRARADLEKLKLICGGTECNEYQGLAAVISSQPR